MISMRVTDFSGQLIGPISSRVKQSSCSWTAWIGRSCLVLCFHGNIQFLKFCSVNIEIHLFYCYSEE